VEEPRTFPSRPLVGVGAVILDGENVLLVRRAHAPLKGEWSLPGGAVELGETLEGAVAREVLEETGLEVEVGPVVDVLDRIHTAPDGRIEYHFVIVDYLCTPRAGDAACGSDASDVQWAPVAALSPYRLTDKASAVIRKAWEIARPSTRADPAAR
jgi:8-oxo-dGTP diphosphatase